MVKSLLDYRRLRCNLLLNLWGERPLPLDDLRELDRPPDRSILVQKQLQMLAGISPLLERHLWLIISVVLYASKSVLCVSKVPCDSLHLRG